MTGSAFRAAAPVSAVCAAFAAQPSTYPPEAPKPDVAPVCGSFTGTAGTEGNRLRAVLGGGEAASGEAGQSHGVVRAPRRSHLPAVRAVSGIYEGVVERVKIAPVGS